MKECSVKEYVLITGASSGIGYALAKEFAVHGKNIIMVSQNEKRLNHAAQMLRQCIGTQHIDIIIYVQDLSKRGAGKMLYNKIKESGVRVSILINNAGVGMSGRFENFDTVQEEEMITLNILNAVSLAREFVNDLRNRNRERFQDVKCYGKSKCHKNIGYYSEKRILVNVSSNGAFQPGPFISSYYASKSYLFNWSLAVREELKEEGIEVVTLCPGATKSNFAKRAGKLQNPYSMSADKVASLAYKGIMAGKRIILPGVGNKLALMCPSYFRSRAVAVMQRKLMK